MATTAASPSPSASPWGKPGGWARDLEKQEEEEEIRQQQQQQQQQHPLSDFPSLSAAAVTKTKKKKKPQSLTLSEFTTGKSVSRSSAQPKGLTTILPTGPRERSVDDEIQNSRGGGGGGGFKSYGTTNRYSNGEEDSSSRWGSSFNKDFNSKADETDDWGAAKKSAPPRDRASSRGNGSGFFDSQSRADESDSWLAKKSFAPSEPPRRMRGFESNGAADSSSTWGNKRGGGGEQGSGRPRLVLQPRSLPVTGDQPVTKTNPFGAARPREQVLAEQLQSVKIDVVSPTERSWRKTHPPTPSEEEEKPDKQGGDAELN